MSFVGNVGVDWHHVRKGVSGAGLGAEELSLGRRRGHGLQPLYSGFCSQASGFRSGRTQCGYSSWR